MTRDEAIKKLVELDNQKPEIKRYYEELAEVLEVLAIGDHFKSDEGQVFLIEAQDGKFVKFDRIKYIRTKKEDEKRGELSVKRANELGYGI